MRCLVTLNIRMSRMKSRITKTFFVLLLLLGADPATAESAEQAWMNIVTRGLRQNPAFAYQHNNPDLPNVLIYGDSISIGYTQRVRTNLADTANVYRLYRNGSDSSTFINGMTLMHRTMRHEALDHPWTFQWDVILFNVGLHDLKYLADGKLDLENGQQVTPIEQYQENLQAIITYLKELAPNAKLIFITTTPVPENAQGRVPGDAARYNAAARAVLDDSPEVAILDLFALTQPNLAQWQTRPGNVHYNTTGTNAQGDAVTGAIATALEVDDPAEDTAE